MVFLRPHDPTATEVLPESMAQVMYIGSEEIHLRSIHNNNFLLVMIPLHNFDHDWIPMEDLESNGLHIANVLPGVTYHTSEPSFVGTIPTRSDIPISQESMRIELRKGFTENIIGHPTGPIRELSNVEVPYDTQLGTLVQIVRGGVTENYIVTRVVTHESPFYTQVITTSYATLREVQPALPSWFCTGARVLSRSTHQEGIVTGIVDGRIHIRQGSVVQAYTLELAQTLFDPIVLTIPPWLSVGVRLRLLKSEQIYTVLEINPVTRVLVVTIDGEHRPQRFSLADVEQHWSLVESLQETRPHDRGRTPYSPYAPELNDILPEWIKPGSFIRTIARPHKILWVASIDRQRGIAKAQRVVKFEPEVQITGTWEEIPFYGHASVKKNYEPLDSTGVPLSEYNCPYCGTFGSRSKSMEERSLKKIRAFSCPKNHRWSFLADGSENDGNLAPLSRFERELDI